MDLSMPVLDGAAATRAIIAAAPGTHVVVLTSFADHHRVADAVAAGAVGYLLKDCDPRDVVTAVRSAAGGNAPIDPRVARSCYPHRTGDGRTRSVSASCRCSG
jgi:DNA-binding NarL/FixJ family response regulator